MNTYYNMRRNSDLTVHLFACLVLIFNAFALPQRSDPYDDLPNNPKNPGGPDDVPVLPLPKKPFSKIVFVSDLPPGETVTFSFDLGAHVYVSSASDHESQIYENNVHLHIPNDPSITPRQMADAGKLVNENGAKQSIFPTAYTSIAVTNTNSDRSNSRTPGIIYFVASNDDGAHYSSVYETGSRRDINTESEHIDNHYVTLLNPTGAVKISDIRHINGLTQLTIVAGGVQEAQDNHYTIYNVGTTDARNHAELIITEPVVTLRKQLAILASDFEFAATAINIDSSTVIIPMRWGQWSVGMSPNYKLRSETRSIKYIFNTTEENTQYDVQLFGELPSTSSLSVQYDGYEGAGVETMSKRQLERLYRNTKGRTLIVDYKRGDDDQTTGVLFRVVCKQPAAATLLYTVFAMVSMKLLFL